MAKGYYKYFNRDISWLSYDSLVLESAKQDDASIGEMLNFISFHSSNLDEFYSVRVAEYRRTAYGDSRMDEVSNPAAMLHRINSIVSSQMNEAAQIITSTLCPKLLAQGVKLHFADAPDDPRHTNFIRNYFEREVIPYVQPVLLGKGTLVFLRDNMPYFAVKLFARQKNGKISSKADYSLVKMPTSGVPRFVTLPDIGDNLTHIVFLDDIIKANLQTLYPGYDVAGAWAIKISRDADLAISETFGVDIAEEIRDNLVLRKTGAPAGFYHDANIPQDLLSCLKANFNFAESEMAVCGPYLNLHDLARLPVDKGHSLSTLAQITPKRLMTCPSMLDETTRGDFMLHYPYQSFNYVIRLINEAAQDPAVTEIKVTQYRVATNSAVVNSLIAAAANNKRVTVFVELKARFDEKNNLEMAERMKAAGIKIIYSIPGLKVHAKVALIERGNDNDRRSVAYISTGNFNEQTARSYTDHGLFTADPDIISDIRVVFNFLETHHEKDIPKDELKKKLKKLLVSRLNMEDELHNLIDREKQIALDGGNAQITLKMNGVQFRPLINDLYEASLAGVKINVIARGICCIVPNHSFSQNIRLTRLVDDHLEHGRVWAFGPDGERGIFITSSDWLNRNMKSRIEVAAPILNSALQTEIMQILSLLINDNSRARYIDENLKNIPVKRNNGDKNIRAQRDIYNLIAKWQSSTDENPTIRFI